MGIYSKFEAKRYGFSRLPLASRFFSTVLFLLSVSDKMYDTRCLQEMSKLLNVRLFFMGLFCLPCIAAEDHSTLTGFAITDTTSCMEFRNKVQKCTEFQEFVNSKTWPNVCLFFLGHFLFVLPAVLLARFRITDTLEFQASVSFCLTTSLSVTYNISVREGFAKSISKHPSLSTSLDIRWSLSPSVEHRIG